MDDADQHPIGAERLENRARFVMRRLFKVLGVFALTIAVVYLSLFALMLWQLRTITDIDEYAEILNEWRPRLTRHFPEAVPPHAEHSKLSFFPGFMQGGAHFQVHFKLPPEEIAQMERRFSKIAIAAGPSDALEDHEFPVPPSHTREPQGWFPSHFTIYFIEARPYKSSGAFKWHHGHTAGVAISRRAGEIVYWAEDW